MLLRYRDSQRSASQETTEHRVDVPSPPAPGASLEVTVDGRKIAIEILRVEGSTIVFRADGRLVRSTAVAIGDRRIVHRAGEFPVSFVRDDGAKKSRGRAVQRGGLEATMHSQVIAVHAKVGASVGRGDVLVTLEAMKMEMRVAAPFAGVVKAISCAVGEVVEQGRVLIEIEPSAAT